MEEITLAIAGVTCRVQSDEKSGLLLESVRQLFNGFFLEHANRHEASVSVFYEDSTVLGKFTAEAVALSTRGNRETARIINHVAKHYPVSEKTLLVGFLNGVLAYNPGRGHALLFLFRSRGKNLLMGTLYKLLFVLTSFLMADNGKLLLHGAGLRIHQHGHLFLGVSGAGKSTVSSFVPTKDVLSDDATVVGKDGDTFLLFASPFSQTNRGERETLPLHQKKATLEKLVFLKKKDGLSLFARDRKSALAEIIALHVHFLGLMDSRLRTAAFSLCCDMCAAIPSFDLHFQKNDGFIALL